MTRLRDALRWERARLWWYPVCVGIETAVAVDPANPGSLRVAGALLAVWFAFWAGWHWREWGRRRDMRRRNTVVIESMDRAASRAAAEYLRWFADEWAAANTTEIPSRSRPASPLPRENDTGVPLHQNGPDDTQRRNEDDSA